MDWALWIFFGVMPGLFAWAHLTAGHEVSKKIQPYVDDLLAFLEGKPKNNKTS